MGVVIAPVDGSGPWPAWMQMVEKRALGSIFTGVSLRVGWYHLEAFHPGCTLPSHGRSTRRRLEASRRSPSRARRPPTYRPSAAAAPARAVPAALGGAP